MTIRINDIKNLNNIFKVLSSLTDTVKLELDRDGMRFNLLDKSHICFVGLECMSYWFTGYDVTSPLTLLLDTSEMSKVLSRGKVGDELILSFEDSNLVLTFLGEYERRFKVRLLDEEYESPMPPSIEFPVSKELILKDLLECLNDVKVYAEKCSFINQEDKLLVECEGMSGSYNASITTLNSVSEDVKATFSLPYLEHLKAFSNVSDLVKLELGDDMPLMATLEAPTGLIVKYMLAPRLSED